MKLTIGSVWETRLLKCKLVASQQGLTRDIEKSSEKLQMFSLGGSNPRITCDRRNPQMHLVKSSRHWVSTASRSNIISILQLGIEGHKSHYRPSSLQASRLRLCYSFLGQCSGTLGRNTCRRWPCSSQCELRKTTWVAWPFWPYGMLISSW